MQPKTVVMSEDLSGVGQVSLGMALPILAVLGATPAVLPTAYLSGHTGGLGAPFTADLAAGIAPTLAHWQALDLQPAGVLLGYLGQTAIGAWREAMPQWPAPVRLLDPAMADGGKLYRGFDAGYVRQMQALAPLATLLTPNWTEAGLLLERPLPPTVSAAAAQAVVRELASRYQGEVIVTGIPLGAATIGTAGQSRNGAWLLTDKRLPGHFFGTGDAFAAVVMGALLAGRDLQPSARLGAGFVAQAIQATLAAGTAPRWGLNVAPALRWLMKTREDAQ